MRGKHVHTFTEVARRFTSPDALKSFKAERLSEAGLTFLNDSMFGFTQIELRCTECGDLKHIKVNGDQR